MWPTAHAPRAAYLLVVPVGLVGLVFGVGLSVLADMPEAHCVEPLWMVVLASFAVGQFVIGGACALLWPRASWRWGVWLYAAPACIISFNGRGVWFFLVWLALTMLPACAGARTAAALHPRPVGPARS
jgi:hypothetical protein